MAPTMGASGMEATSAPQCELYEGGRCIGYRGRGPVLGRLMPNYLASARIV
jgi:hypothetical protein